MRMGREMRLTMQIGEYEMDQAILDLGSNMNILPKQAWGAHGEASTTVVSYEAMNGEPT